MVTIRATVATVLLRLPIAMYRPRSLRVPRWAIPRLAFFGLVTGTLLYIALIVTFDRTTVAFGTPLLYLAPVFVAGGGRLFLGEPFIRPQISCACTGPGRLCPGGGRLSNPLSDGTRIGSGRRPSGSTPLCKLERAWQVSPRPALDVDRPRVPPGLRLGGFADG